MDFNHILYIDPLEKLSLKKDSSLQLALALKLSGHKVSLIFEKDFYFDNSARPVLKVYDFEGQFEEGSPYLKNFSLREEGEVQLDSSVVLHMRIDPPFDSRYLRYLWMLRALKVKYGVRVINDPDGIAIHNEKMVSYEREDSVETYVGSSNDGFNQFVKNLKGKNDYSGLILKPLDLFQGIGVEFLDNKVTDDSLLAAFERKKKEYGGAVVAQPFLPQVKEGELRALYFNGIELGTIIKTPPEGKFLANIAQGAKYKAFEMDQELKNRLKEMSLDFAKKGVPWIAYDVLGGKIQEANLTCPGLLVEVSSGVGKNLAFTLVELMEDYLRKFN